MENSGGEAMNEKALGKRLQQARQAAGLTQQTLCQKANLSYSTLAKIERGAIKSPSIFTIQSIAGALGVSLDELVGVSPASANPSRQLSRTASGASFIYFDINGCLVRSYHRAFTRLAERASEPIDAVEAVFWHYNDMVCRGEMSMSDFNAELAQRLNLPEVDWAAYYLDSVEPTSELQELLRWASAHYRVGLFSNTMPGLIGAMRSRGILPDLSYDVIVDSSAVGAIKPEDKIYEIGEQHAGVPGNEVMLIDDTRANLMAAEKRGWHVLWFDGFEAAESVERLKAALEPVSA